ncbi:MAG: hypothetical protein ACTSPH_06715 [Promethearchaeota archaeon]
MVLVSVINFAYNNILEAMELLFLIMMRVFFEIWGAFLFLVSFVIKEFQG